MPSASSDLLEINVYSTIINEFVQSKEGIYNNYNNFLQLISIL
jgi:hypothetical protein